MIAHTNIETWLSWQYYLYYLIESWANNERVREALHVQKVFANLGLRSLMI